ncbi:MAG: flagellar export protein FliJ [Oscillospiraceae bacterium]|nr:flagellar export protein FliJ [Oscillospiraceae bacterium]
MKKFKFTLEAPLRVKRILEKQQMAELAAVNARLAEFRRELERLRDALDFQRRTYLESVEAGRLTAPEMSLWSVGFKGMRERIALQNKKIETAEGERRRIQRKLVELMKERKILEKLRDNQMAEYRLAQKAEDAAVIDDFVSSKIHREGNAHG